MIGFVFSFEFLFKNRSTLGCFVVQGGTLVMVELYIIVVSILESFRIPSIRRPKVFITFSFILNRVLSL